MSEIIDCPVCGDTVEEHIAQAGEERIRADERERCVQRVTECYYKTSFGRKDVIEAIKAE